MSSSVRGVTLLDITNSSKHADMIHLQLPKRHGDTELAVMNNIVASAVSEIRTGRTIQWI